MTEEYAALKKQVQEELQAEGWASPEMVRALVAGAGGAIRIPDKVLIDPPPILNKWYDKREMSTVYTTQRTQRR